MGRNRFVSPRIVRLDLSDGDYLDVKYELTAGEERKSMATMVKRLEAGQAAELDPEKVELATIAGYVVGWSFTNGTGDPIPVTESAILHLTSETFTEVYQAIAAHEQRVVAEKKVTLTAAPAS